MKNNCLNCINRVGTDFCTMRKNMNLAQYKKCDGHKILPKKAKPVSKPKTKRITGVLSDKHFKSKFMKFLKNGGFYSFRTGEYQPE